MNTRILLGVVIVLAFVAFGITLYYSLQNSEEIRNDTESTQETAPGYLPDVVSVLHQFKDGMHTIAGEVDVPTPCDLLQAEAVVEVREPREDMVTLQFTTLNDADTCAQVITAARFKETFSAGEKAEFTALWNGRPVRLNIVEVGPNDSIDDFDVYFKG